MKNKLILLKPLISCILLLTILAFSIYTFGWFSNNNVVHGGLSFKINQEPVSATQFTAYFFDEDEHTVKAVYNGQVELPAYDTVFTEKNTMNSIIFRIPVFGKVLEADQPFDITLNLKSLPEDNILSDVIFVRAMAIDELQLQNTGEVGPEEIYMTAREHLTNWPTLTFFNNGGKKTDSITLTISDYTSPDSSSYLNIYMEIGYDPVLINNWLVKNDMTISSDLVGRVDNLITLYGDIDTFVFSAHE